ncbi:hypothetical protein V8J88_05540 [Massilia sp. W12]|uniref:hypothetical protein n=1 Tax=Massilia sp. W12 TaxID=3126507 RepID=UPI0030D3DE1C
MKFHEFNKNKIIGLKNKGDGVIDFLDISVLSKTSENECGDFFRSLFKGWMLKIFYCTGEISKRDVNMVIKQSCINFGEVDFDYSEDMGQVEMDTKGVFNIFPMMGNHGESLFFFTKNPERALKDMKEYIEEQELEGYCFRIINPVRFY